MDLLSTKFGPAIVLLALFLVPATISLICAKPGRKWVWSLYGIGAGIAGYCLVGSAGKEADSGLIALEMLLFVAALILYGIFISKRLSSSGTASNKQMKSPQSVSDHTDTATKTNQTSSPLQSAPDSHFDALAQEKVPKDKLTESSLVETFVSYFAPNTGFYAPGSPKAAAYFGAVNAAKIEILNQEMLLSAATKWSKEEYATLLRNPPPGIGNMQICGLIFKMGEFAVVKDMVYCVDFADRIPNCIALYLLLIAQKQPENQRTQILDTGSGTNTTAFSNAVNALRICDSNWKCMIW